MGAEFRSVQCGRRLRLVAPGPAPELLALLRRQPAAHADDRVDLLEGRPAGDALLEGHFDRVHHVMDRSYPVQAVSNRKGHTTNWPSRCSSSPSTVIEPPVRRSQTMSQCTA